LGQISNMMDLIEIREEGVTLQVISEWGPWSPCKQCIDNRGIKTSRGYCRLKRSINSVSITYIFSLIVGYLVYNIELYLYYCFINIYYYFRL